MFFGLLWINSWLTYSSHFIVMVSASTYYFNSDASKEGQAEVELGFKFAYLYHMGSLAAGSLFIAIIQFIKYCFMYIAEQAQKASGENTAVKCIAGCGNCCIALLEKVCDYVNEAAFCYLAVSGEPFMTSAWNGFLLHVKHMLKFSFANFIAKVFTFIGKIAITVGNCFSLYFIMKNVTKDTEEVTSLIGPMVVVGLTTYISATIFLGMFDTAVMALMTCLAIDMDLHDGEPAFGPPTFHDSIGKVSAGKHSHRKDNHANNMV